MLNIVTGIGMLVCTYIYMVIWVWTAEVNAKRIRERYLKAVLRQDIAYFDNVGAGEVATRIQTDTRKSQNWCCRGVDTHLAWQTWYSRASLRRSPSASTSLLPSSRVSC